MPTMHLGRHADHPTTTTPHANPWLWLAGGMLLFFLVPLVGADMLALQPDTYYLIYFTVAVAWFTVFVSAYAAELHDLWRNNLGLSLVVGAVAGAALVAMVLGQAGTDHLDGWRFAFEILWRGRSTAASTR